MSNLALWESVEKTDLDHTKYVSQRGGFTSIDPAYQAKVATEKFGTYGLGWGLSESEFDYSQFAATGMVIHKATFFYTLDGNRASFPIHNAVFPMPVSKGTAKADESWPKKVETNTISKALSRLGFNADVFLGKFEDTEYKELLKVEQDIEKSEDREKEIKQKRDDLSAYVLRQLEAIKSYESANISNKVVQAATSHLERHKAIPELRAIAERGLSAIAKAYEEQKAKFKEAS